MTAPTPAHARLIAGDLVRVLLVEDDHGDAFLVSELLREEGAPVEVHRAQSLAEGLALLATRRSTASCSTSACRTRAGSSPSRPARGRPAPRHLVLTGDRDDQRGIDAVAPAHRTTSSRAPRGRRPAESDHLRRRASPGRQRPQQLRAAEILAEEATRLERGLLPVPILNDPALRVGTGYRPGRERTLLGGGLLRPGAHARWRRAPHDRRRQRARRRRGRPRRVPARGVEDADARWRRRRARAAHAAAGARARAPRRGNLRHGLDRDDPADRASAAVRSAGTHRPCCSATAADGRADGHRAAARSLRRGALARGQIALPRAGG